MTDLKEMLDVAATDSEGLEFLLRLEKEVKGMITCKKPQQMLAHLYRAGMIDFTLDTVFITVKGVELVELIEKTLDDATVKDVEEELEKDFIKKNDNS